LVSNVFNRDDNLKIISSLKRCKLLVCVAHFSTPECVLILLNVSALQVGGNSKY